MSVFRADVSVTCQRGTLQAPHDQVQKGDAPGTPVALHLQYNGQRFTGYKILGSLIGCILGLPHEPWNLLLWGGDLVQ